MNVNFIKNITNTTTEMLIKTIDTSKLKLEICNKPNIPKINASVANNMTTNTQTFLQQIPHMFQIFFLICF
jgi:hypothetical protein